MEDNYTDDVNVCTYDVKCEYHDSDGECLSEWYMEEQYDLLLDDCHDVIQIGGVSLMPSDVLKSTDPIAYRVGFHDYVDAQVADEVWVEVVAD